MKFKIRVVIESDTIGGDFAQDIAVIERQSDQIEQMGMSLAEGKSILKALQKTIIETQAGEYLRSKAHCDACDSRLLHKGSHTIPFRTLFGKIMLDSPRLHHCACTPRPTKTFSPLTKLLPQRTSPELLFLETKWASLMSYDITTKLLQDVLPIDEKINPATVRNNLMKVAERCEQSLGKEQYMFIDCWWTIRNDHVAN